MILKFAKVFIFLGFVFIISSGWAKIAVRPPWNESYVPSEIIARAKAEGKMAVVALYDPTCSVYTGYISAFVGWVSGVSTTRGERPPIDLLVKDAYVPYLVDLTNPIIYPSPEEMRRRGLTSNMVSVFTPYLKALDIRGGICLILPGQNQSCIGVVPNSLTNSLASYLVLQGTVIKRLAPMVLNLQNGQSIKSAQFNVLGKGFPSAMSDSVWYRLNGGTWKKAAGSEVSFSAPKLGRMKNSTVTGVKEWRADLVSMKKGQNIFEVYIVYKKYPQFWDTRKPADKRYASGRMNRITFNYEGP